MTESPIAETLPGTKAGPGGGRVDVVVVGAEV